MNAKSGSGSTGTFIWGLVAGVVVVVIAGGMYLLGLFGGSEERAEPEVTETAEPVAEADTQETEQSEKQPETQTEEAAKPDAAETQVEDVDDAAVPDDDAGPVIAAPVLDQIFVEPDGNALLSGNAEPGSEVNVMLDGQAVHSFTVDESGQFAEFVSIPFADDARGLVLETQNGDETTQSDDYIIAALPAPAEGEETSAPATEQTTESGEAEADVAVAATTEPDATETETATTETSEDQTEVANADASTTEQPEAGEERQTDTDATSGQQIAILRSGEEGVELVQPSATTVAPPEQIALDTIGYSDTGDVELTGRAQDGSAVRLYLDNRLVADLTPEADGQWRGEVEGIDPGVYTLRVDEVAPDGTVVSRLETPFKREPVEALRAAETTETTETPAETPPIRSVTVQKGDTLWAISRDRFGDGVLYVKLFEANKDAIRDPDLIYPGQIFTIPE